MPRFSELRREYRRIVSQLSRLLQTIAKAAGKRHFRRNLLARAAFHVEGGIGDHVIAARFIRDLTDAAGEFEFDIYCSRIDAGLWLFSHLPGVCNVYSDSSRTLDWRKQYPLCFVIMEFVSVANKKYREKGLLQNERLLIAADSIVSRCVGMVGLCISKQPALDSHLARYARFLDLDRYTFANWMAQIPAGGTLFPLPSDASFAERVGLVEKRYVTIHNGFDTADSSPDAPCTKVYPRFHELVALLHDRFPGLTIVQVGASTSESVAGIDVDFVGRTSLPETRRRDQRVGVAHRQRVRVSFTSRPAWGPSRACCSGRRRATSLVIETTSTSGRLFAAIVGGPIGNGAARV